MLEISTQKQPDLLDLPIEKIKGIGSKTAQILARLELKSVVDLLEHYPYRYEDYSRNKKIRELQTNESVTIKAKVTNIQVRRAMRNKRITITEAVLTDDTGNILAVWFNQPYLKNILFKGQEYYFYGTTLLRNRLQLQSPTFENISDNTVGAGKIMPIYSLPDGIPAKKFRTIILQLLGSLPEKLDFLPLDLAAGLKLVSRREALKQIHFPDSFKKLAQARHRLAFDELLIMQLKILHRRETLKKSNAPKIIFLQNKIKKFVEDLPFKLTLSQKRAAWEIIQDLETNAPMNRLLQGDVGSGKTVVSAIAIASCAWNKQQVAFLAPTEILVQQHFATLKKLLEPEKIVIALLTGGSSGKEKKEIYEGLTKGKINCVVGTHAILNEKISFKNLGLVIVDEQHRFGVSQRSILRNPQVRPAKNSGLTWNPHFLSMTATPIPRTLALTLYGDLAISSITEMPPGRPEIKTEVVLPDNRQKAYGLISKEILLGRQGFVICPLLEDSDVLEVKSATAEQQRLAKEVFPSFSIGLMHGKMTASEKERTMKTFKDGRHHILVSTSVIEVGIDVPNATVMLIEGADRFGLAQLHQFRGRVGRGEHASYCLVIPSNNTVPERLKILVKHQDGFRLAELDLKLRGMGEITGTKQSGFLDLKIADPSDLNLVKLARQTAEKIIAPGLNHFPRLKQLMDKQEMTHAE